MKQSNVGRTSNPKKTSVPATNVKPVAHAQPKISRDASPNSQYRNLQKAQVPGLQQVKIQDIQNILDQNNNKRQNVNFLKNLLDSQLNALSTNLKFMQSDNSEIETDTIARLQIIDKFGQDAAQGLALAKQNESKISSDLQEQKSQHTEVMQE